MIMLKTKIRSVVNEVLEAILDPELKELVKTKTFLTGGCFKALYHGEEVNDYDFYFVDKEASIKFVQLIHTGLEKREGPGFTDRKKLHLMDLAHKSQFAISFNLKSADDKKVKIQFITKYFGLPDEVTGHFDFMHTMNYYVPIFDAFKIDERALEEKKLIFNERATHPINALKRVPKFLKTGWTIDDPEIMKMAEAINALDLLDDEVYTEQASGMYLYRESKMRGYNSRRNVG